MSTSLKLVWYFDHPKLGLIRAIGDYWPGCMPEWDAMFFTEDGTDCSRQIYTELDDEESPVLSEKILNEAERTYLDLSYSQPEEPDNESR